MRINTKIGHYAPVGDLLEFLRVCPGVIAEADDGIRFGVIFKLNEQRVQIGCGPQGAAGLEQ